MRQSPFKGYATLVYIGAFQGSRDWGDLVALLVFAIVGWVMKQLKWPRPPLILGFVLGGLIERYLFISTARYGYDWLTRPFVVLVLAFAAFIVLRPLYTHLKQTMRRVTSQGAGPVRFAQSDLMYVALIALVGWMTVQAWGWAAGARQGPLFVGIASLILLLLGLLGQVGNRSFVRQGTAEDDPLDIHMDSTVDFGDLTPGQIAGRGAIFFGYLVAFMASAAVVGFILTIPLFVALFLAVEKGESWKVYVGHSVLIVALVIAVFDQALRLPWPPTLLGIWLPALSILPGV